MRYEHRSDRPAQGTIWTACAIAEKYRHRLPTWRELVASYGMNRSTAYRWVRAIKDARGIG